MNNAREVRDDFHGAIKTAIEDEGLITPATAGRKEGRSARVVSYANGKRFRVTVEEIRIAAEG